MSLFSVLLERGDSVEEARELITEMKERVADGEDPEEVLYDEGLDPDYIEDLF